jgi:hypothetical protein
MGNGLKCRLCGSSGWWLIVILFNIGWRRAPPAASIDSIGMLVVFGTAGAVAGVALMGAAGSNSRSPRPRECGHATTLLDTLKPSSFDVVE